MTGWLSTILWLIVLQREGEHVAPGGFKLGLIVMPPAPLVSRAALSIAPP